MALKNVATTLYIRKNVNMAFGLRTVSDVKFHEFLQPDATTVIARVVVVHDITSATTIYVYFEYVHRT